MINLNESSETMKFDHEKNSYDETELTSMKFVRMEITTALDENRKTQKFKLTEKKCEQFRYLLHLITGPVLLLICVLTYLASLEGCPFEQNECLEKFGQEKAISIGRLIITSAFCFVLLIYFTIFKKIQKGSFILSIPIMMFLLFIYDTGADLASHGSYNMQFFLVIGVLIFIFLGILIGLGFLIKKIPLTIIFVFIIAFFLKWFIESSIEKSCEYFDKGFKGSQISKTDGNCKIPIPDTCFLYYTSNFFDVSAWTNFECSTNHDELEYTGLRHFSNKTNSSVLGYPRTESWSFFPRSTLKNWTWEIYNSVIDMETATEEKKKDIEVYVNFTTQPHPKVHIEIKKNQTLIDERAKNWDSKGKDNAIFKNILMIYIDSLSRNHFRRKLKKTYAFLEQYYNNTEGNFSTYQFFKLHALNYYTYANMIPGYFGEFKLTLKNGVDKGTYFLWDAKDTGYITGQSYDVCSRETFDLEPTWDVYLNYTNYDHEFTPFYCDPNFSDPLRPYQSLKGAYSIKRRCMYGQDAGTYQIEYATKFFDTYRDQPKLFRMGFLDSHEGTGEMMKYMDDPIHNFLLDLQNKGHLDDTVVFFQSDHGFSMAGPTYMIKPRDYFYEVFLPTIIYMVPRSNKWFIQMNRGMKSNENKFVTAFDSHAALLHMFNFKKITTQYGKSLLTTIDDRQRSCEKYQMDKNYCMCDYP
jgi:hypothetical protein